MAWVKAEPRIAVIRNDHGATFAKTKITYEKESADELWVRVDNGNWRHIEDLSTFDPVTETPRFAGSFNFELKAGESFEVGIFAENAGPPDPRQLAGVKAFGVNKEPEAKNLLAGSWHEAGGTFVHQFIQTSEPTEVAIIGCKRGEFDFDGDGLPKFDDAEGVTWDMHHPSSGHSIFVMPLLPGNDYVLQAVVVDDFGNWEVFRSDFRTQSRKVTVQFQTLHIYNDSDPGGEGEAEFNFSLFVGYPPGNLRLVEQFNRPEADIDDWGRTDRPYHLGFAHIGDFVSVPEAERDLFVRSTGLEFDGFDPDEGAWSKGGLIVLPYGLDEQVVNRRFLLNCPPSTNGSDFHYGVDIIWSVEYELRP